MALEHRPTSELEQKLEQAELAGNWERAERIEAELERRDDQGQHEDSPSLADQGLYLGSYGN